MIRVYFNSHAEAPLLWSVDLGAQETEVRVKQVKWEVSSGNTAYDFSVSPSDTVRPRAWIEFRYSVLEIHDDIAYIFHNPEWRKPRIGA